jgi:hypothetical protein
MPPNQPLGIPGFGRAATRRDCWSSSSSLNTSGSGRRVTGQGSRAAPRGRAPAKGVVAGLVRLTDHPMQLTTDAARPAGRIAADAGIDAARLAALRRKADIVRARQAAGHEVLLVGDGGNDAPALGCRRCRDRADQASTSHLTPCRRRHRPRRPHHRPRGHRLVSPSQTCRHRKPTDRREVHHGADSLRPRPEIAPAAGRPRPGRLHGDCRPQWAAAPTTRSVASAWQPMRSEHHAGDSYAAAIARRNTSYG